MEYIIQANMINKALKEANNPVEFYIFKNQAYGMYTDQSRLLYFQKIMTFLAT